jgi:flagellar protein FlbD
MIQATRLNGAEFWVNQDHIQFLEKTPETVLTLSDGKKLTVKETPEQVIGRILEFRRLAAPPVVPKEEAQG